MRGAASNSREGRLGRTVDTVAAVEDNVTVRALGNGDASVQGERGRRADQGLDGAALMPNIIELISVDEGF